MPAQARPNPIRRCQHLKINGEQCGSPALKGKRRCYFHNVYQPVVVDLANGCPRPRTARFAFPVLEDANSIQIALMQVVDLLMTRQIEPKVAGLLLYALQTASSNLRHTTFNPEPENVTIEPRKVASIGLGQKAWQHPPSPLAEMSQEQRKELAQIALRHAFSGDHTLGEGLLLYKKITESDPSKSAPDPGNDHRGFSEIMAQTILSAGATGDHESPDHHDTNELGHHHHGQDPQPAPH